MIEVHLRGSFNVCRATIEHFRDQEDGAYVLFTSTSGLIGNIGQTNYAAAKMGIDGPVADHRHGGREQERALQHHRPGGLDPDDPVGAGQGRGRRRAPRSAMAEAIRPDQPATLAVALCSPTRAKEVSGQIFGARGDDLLLYSQPRPIATLSQPDGWTPASILAEAFPQMSGQFYPVAAPRPAPVAAG